MVQFCHKQSWGSDLKGQRARLDTISGRFFMLGFISAKLKNIQIASIASKLNLVSIAAYLMGYTAWYVATFLYPHHPKLQTNWYGFAPYKYQYQAAAFLGAIASTICLLAPEMALAAAWVYVFSNLIWAIGEHHKGKYQTINVGDDYSPEKQAHYFRFTLLVAIGSTLSAILTTASILMPAAANVIMTVNSIISVIFMFASFYYWFKAAFYTPAPINHLIHAPEATDTCTQLLEKLSLNQANAPSTNTDHDDTSYPSLFHRVNANVMEHIIPDRNLTNLSPVF